MSCYEDETAFLFKVVIFKKDSANNMSRIVLVIRSYLETVRAEPDGAKYKFQRRALPSKLQLIYFIIFKQGPVAK